MTVVSLYYARLNRLCVELSSDPIHGGRKGWRALHPGLSATLRKETRMARKRVKRAAARRAVKRRAVKRAVVRRAVKKRAVKRAVAKRALKRAIVKRAIRRAIISNALMQERGAGSTE